VTTEDAGSFDARLDATPRTEDLLLRKPGASALLHEIVRLELQAIGAGQDSTFTLQGQKSSLPYLFGGSATLEFSQ
jgi:hypothetical protein